MEIIPYLIIVPFCIGVLSLLIKNPNARGSVTWVGAVSIICGVLYLAYRYLTSGAQDQMFYLETHTADMVMTVGEVLLMLLVVFLCFKYRKYWICLLSVIPTCMMLYMEFMMPKSEEISHIHVDHLSILMCLIVGIVGSLIIIYSVGYMKGYHEHHKEVEDRSNYFTMLLFMFIGAMMGLVLSESLVWLVFFWECTSICSFLLIGYTRTEEAIRNSFRALWMNLLGGAALVCGVVFTVWAGGIPTLRFLIAVGVQGVPAAAIPIALLAFAALTKSAQLPFSTWLLGAMVAPTPSSALLHSATMVKAGVYLLLRLAPAMAGTMIGTMIAFVGGFTFLVTAMIAITRSDGKEILAYSTISNLGLMVACAGIGHMETVWAGIFLMIFHAVSKSLLFQAVGATENASHSRDVEDMHGLLYRLPRLAIFLFIGIAGMFLAPFGMLIAKWSAFRASVDSGNVMMVFFIAFGSALTAMYWTKWMGKLIAHSHKSDTKEYDVTKGDETFSMVIHTAMMLILCVLFPWVSQFYVDPLLVEMYGFGAAVLPRIILYVMIGVVLLVFAVPYISYSYVKNRKEEHKLSYMNGINTGDNRSFTDYLGEDKTLWLSNYYFEERFGQHKLMLPGQLVSAAVIIILIVVIIGGVVA